MKNLLFDVQFCFSPLIFSLLKNIYPCTTQIKQKYGRSNAKLKTLPIAPFKPKLEKSV